MTILLTMHLFQYFFLLPHMKGKKTSKKYFNAMCTYNTYFRMFHSVLSHLNCQLNWQFHCHIASQFIRFDWSDCKNQKLNIRWPRISFPSHIYGTNNCKKKRWLKTPKNAKSLQKYKGIKTHFIAFKLTCHRMSNALREPFLIKNN